MYESLDKLPLLLSLSEVEKFVGLSKSTVMKWLMNGNPEEFPAQKIGQAWKVNKHKLAEWLELDHGDLRVTTTIQAKAIKDARGDI